MKFILLSLLIVCSCKISKDTPSQTTAALSTTEELSLQDLINNYRESLNLPHLTFAQPLNEISKTHSSSMAKGLTSFGHDGFSARCSQARTALGGGNLCGENVARGQITAQQVFDAWLNSPGHRANIEQDRFNQSGLSSSISSDGTVYWTHLFLEK